MIEPNAKCPCGSGRQFKNCCEKKTGPETDLAASHESNPTADAASSRMKVLLVLLAGIIVAGGLFLYFKDSLIAARKIPAAYTEAESIESHQMMVEALQIIGSLSSVGHPYLGNAELTEIRQAFQQMASTATPAQLCDLHFAAGLREGRLGNLRAAIAELKSAYDLLPAASFDEAKANYIKFKLGVSYLRLGETENCCVTGGPESCIVPIGPSGVHDKKEGSQNAIRYFEEILRAGGDDVTFSRTDASPNSSDNVKVYLAAKWLLNVAHMTLGTYPDQVAEEFRVPESAFRSSTDIPKFRNIAAQLSLDTVDLCGGVIVDDFDEDGYLDLVTSTWDPSGELNYFHNNADGTFENRTKMAGLTGIFGGLNINQTDYNNDGHLDIFVMRGAWLQTSGKMPNSLLRNNGDGTFTDVTFISGLGGSVDYPTQSSDWADYDNDGDLDLFVGNEHNELIEAPCQLFRNNGDGTFMDVAEQAGVQNFRFTKGACFGDYDNDGDMDLYLSNLRMPNRMYRNNGDGTFTDVAPEINVTSPSESFPTWFFDYDNDGALDLFVAGYTGMIDNLVGHYCETGTDFEPSCLYKGDGQGGFRNVTDEQGLNVPMLPMGSNFGDLNNDGYLDFYLGTGDPEYESLTPNMMFLNKGGTGFDDVTMAGGFGHLQKGHGIAFADLDNDGDAEVFEQMGGAFLGDKFGNVLFENPGFENKWLSLQLVGVQSNRAAIGARISVKISENGETRTVYRHVNSGGSFGANPLRQTVGLGKAVTIDELSVYWPTTGKTQTFDDVSVNQFYRITENKSELEKLSLKVFKLGGS